MVVRREDIHEVEIDLTGTCNLSCYICSRNFTHSEHMVKRNIRSLSEITSQLDTFPNLKTFMLAGVVSEPTLYPDFFGLLGYLNGRNIKYDIHSNGNTHDRGWWEELGQMVPKDCKMIFTICGSTQEIHGKYRVGSNLQQILNNAESFRKNNRKNDYVQFIRFEYNESELHLGNMDLIFRQFSNRIIVHSEGIRMDDRKKRENPPDVRPPKDIDAKIRYIFKRCRSGNSRVNCKLDRWKKIYIDQFGNLFPCYTYAEYGFPPLGRFDDEFNVDEIVLDKFDTCFLCSDEAEKLMKTLGV